MPRAPKSELVRMFNWTAQNGTRLPVDGIREWEQTFAEKEPDVPAVLYRHKISGDLDWTPATTWDRLHPDQLKQTREVLLRTTTAEAVRLKWLSY